MTDKTIPQGNPAEVSCLAEKLTKHEADLKDAPQGYNNGLGRDCQFNYPTML